MADQADQPGQEYRRRSTSSAKTAPWLFASGFADILRRTCSGGFRVRCGEKAMCDSRAARVPVVAVCRTAQIPRGNYDVRIAI